MGKQMGMGLVMGRTAIDERGRVTIPKDARQKAGLHSGDRLRVQATKGRLTLEKQVDLETFIQELRGCITIKGDLDPLRLKEIWRTAP
jgi:AbrB family looped-hinge helix DNA binding protein